MAEAADGFLKTLLRSGLLGREQLEEALRSLPKERQENPQEMANHLIRVGRLSRFQALKLLHGVTRGLKLGPFQVLTPIGRGGMGAVYLALDTRNGRHVAVKVLPPKRARQEERYLTRFQREMELSKKVQHPHIAQTHEVGVSDGVYYIAMEYIPGLSLYRMVNTQGPLDVSRVAHLFSEVASALEHAHGVGLVHRDLKPSNIMITPNEHAKVLDFGLAMMEGEEVEDSQVLGGRGYVVGSVDYMAPEQTFDSTQVDGRSDLYALGCCIYFALSGKAPFPGGTSKEKIQAHRRQEPDPIQWRNSNIPDEFAGIIDKLLAKKPEQRYANAAALRLALAPWCPPIEVRPVEREGDQAQVEAALALEAAPLSADALGDTLPGSPDGQRVTVELLPEAKLLQDGEKNEMLPIVLGIVAFWAVVLLVLVIVVLVR
ncbi:MAG: serine/threonine protein kinase [Gemmataceae bacterium]|nr:serine/threonine protein kinase [Gemmataceae bacterium]